MRFLVDANLPLSTAPRIQACGHEVVDVRSVNMGAADDSVIANHARQNDKVATGFLLTLVGAMAQG